MVSLFYLGLFICFFALSIFFAVYFLLMLYSAFEGAPYVPTRDKDILEILSYAKLEPNQTFLELGCGDGRVTRTAVQHFHVRGIGIDVNLGLVLWARCKAWFQGLPHIQFRRDNVRSMSFDTIDVIYMFLLPKLIKTFSQRLALEVNPGTLVISHGFAVPGWEQYLMSKRHSRTFPTYYYKIQMND
jgi:cyclopropane fatty-acyl-phospholipid synthase-like methyltransferase